MNTNEVSNGITGSAAQAGDTWNTEDGRMMVAIQTGGGLVAMEMIHEIPTGDIDPHPANRDEFDPEKASDMEDSLRKNKQITPAIVRPMPDGRFQLIAGERRWRGCKAVGIPTLRAVIRSYNDEQALEILIWENLERENLSELQEARMYQALMDMKDAEGRNLYTLEKIAEKRFGDVKKLDRVARVLKLNGLPEIMKKALKAGSIKTRHAFLVARIAEPKAREQAAKEVLNDPYGSGPMTVDRAQRHIAEKFQVNLKGVKFDKESAAILSEEVKEKLGFDGQAGENNDSSCVRCQWLAKNNPAFAGELAVKSRDGKSQPGIDPDTCTFAACFQAKMEAIWMQRALPFAEKHHVKPDAIRARKDGGDCFVDCRDGVYSLTGRINDTRVLVDGEIRPWQVGLQIEEMPSKVPTWRDVMKGCEVPLEIIAGPKGEPVLIADKALAVMAGKQTRPDLFTKAKAHLNKKDMNDEELAAQEAAERAAAEAQKRERAINKGTQSGTIRMLLDKVREKGPGLAMLQSLCRAAMSNMNNDLEETTEWWYGKKMPELDGLDHEEVCEQMMEGLGVNDLLALLTLLLITDDVSYSWSKTMPRDLGALCAEYGIDPQTVRKQLEKEYDAAAKQAAADAAAKVKPKMKSKGKDLDGDRDTELKNEELAKAAILEQGDRERELAPSHRQTHDTAPLRECAVNGVGCAADVFRQLQTLDVPVMTKNPHGVFERPSALVCQIGKGVSFEIQLARDSAGHWFKSVDYLIGNRGGGGLPKDGHVYQIRACAVADAVRELVSAFKTPATPKAAEKAAVLAREFLAKLQALADKDAADAGDAWQKEHNSPEAIASGDSFTEEELNACREWKKMNPEAGAAAMADALSLTMDEAYAICDRLVDEKHDARAEVKSKHAAEEFEAQVKQIAEGKAKPSDFIGPKPSPTAKPAEYNAWSAQRMKLKRAADKLKKAA